MRQILDEAERRGEENRQRLEAGEELERRDDVAPFDFIYFYDSLNVIMMDNMAFFEKLSKDTTFMFLKNDFKNGSAVLKAMKPKRLLKNELDTEPKGDKTGAWEKRQAEIRNKYQKQ